jgi:hypothetical protein
LVLIVLSLALAACGTPSPNRMHSVDIVSEDGELAFEIKMNGCYVARKGGETQGSVILVFPATRAGGQARAERIHGATGLLRTARDSRAGLKPLCPNLRYTLTYY